MRAGSLGDFSAAVRLAGVRFLKQLLYIFLGVDPALAFIKKKL